MGKVHACKGAGSTVHGLSCGRVIGPPGVEYKAEIRVDINHIGIQGKQMEEHKEDGE